MADIGPKRWAATILKHLGIPQTPGAMQALIGWERAEGGHWHNDARYNPLNTTQEMPGAGNTGTQGNIKQYTSWQQGIDATIKTLRNGRYDHIIRALRAGDPGAVANAIGQSPWGTSSGLIHQTIAGTMPAQASPAGLPSGGPQGPSTTTKTTTRTLPGVDNSEARRALILQFLQQRHQPGALVNLASGLKANPDTPDVRVASTRTVRRAAAPGVPGSAPASGDPTARGAVDFEGKPVAAWIAPILRYARKQGWKGKVNEGLRSNATQAQYYREYQAGTRAGPVAAPGTSNHRGTVFPLGAIDVEDPEGLNAILRRSPYARKLVWAGAKDHPHFSHPHGGSY